MWHQGECRGHWDGGLCHQVYHVRKTGSIGKHGGNIEIEWGDDWSLFCVMSQIEWKIEPGMECVEL
jgi:hypothetical protein